jgi:N-methylhydantoinase B
VIAGHHADLLASSFHGINNRTSEFFIGSFGPLGGGWGAKMTEDGVSGTVCINDGDTHNSPNEQAEFKFPIVVERYALVPDSGGAGRHRGGLGVERVVRARTNMMVNNQSDRAHCRPWGPERRPRRRRQRGGAAHRRDNGRPIFPMPRCWWRNSSPATPSKSARAVAAATAVLRAPVDRSATTSAGLCHGESAAELYGVVLDPELRVDMAATEKLRAARPRTTRRTAKSA